MPQSKRRHVAKKTSSGPTHKHTWERKTRVGDAVSLVASGIAYASEYDVIGLSYTMFGTITRIVIGDVK